MEEIVQKNLKNVSHNARVMILVIMVSSITVGYVVKSDADSLAQALAVGCFGAIALVTFVIVIWDRFIERKIRRKSQVKPELQRFRKIYTMPTSSFEDGPERVFADILSHTLHLEDTIKSYHTAKQDHEIFLPSLDALTVAYRLMNYCSKQYPDARIVARAIHSIPSERSEAHWWSCELARKYMDIQEKLILQQKLTVQRLLVVEQEDKLHAEDVAPWYEQPARKIQLRRCTSLLPELSRQNATDCLILDIHKPQSTPDDPDVELQIALLQVDHESEHAHMRLIACSPTSTAPPMRISNEFDTMWDQSSLLEIIPEDDHPNNEPWWDPDYLKQGTLGFLAFKNALRRVASAHQFVRAVDVSDLKDGLSHVRMDPSYSTWYRITNSKIGSIDFMRAFILKRTHESVSEFLDHHAGEYFDESGQPIAKCKIAVVFEDLIDKSISDESDQSIDEWFAQIPLVTRHMQRVLPKKDAPSNEMPWDEMKPREQLSELLKRDFLFTEGIIYDYRTNSTAFDMRTLPDFLDDFKEHEKREDARQWEQVVERLVKCAIVSPAARWPVLEAALRAGVVDEDSSGSDPR